MTLSDNESIKHIYIVKIIEDEGERIVFTTFDLKYAERWCTKANKMIKKWQKYFDKFWFKNENTPNNDFRFWKWNEARIAVIVKTEIR